MAPDLEDEELLPGSKKRWGDEVAGYGGYRYFLCNRRKMTGRERTRKKIHSSLGTWTLDTFEGCLKLYVTCPNCGRINLIDAGHSIMSDGRLYYPCVVCPFCVQHFFPHFLGWKEDFFFRIGKRVRRTVTHDAKKKQ